MRPLKALALLGFLLLLCLNCSNVGKPCVTADTCSTSYCRDGYCAKFSGPSSADLFVISFFSGMFGSMAMGMAMRRR
ncbi:MAG: hypothetical protein V4510_12410 [bacterium]